MERKDSPMEAIAVEHVTKRFDTLVAVSDLSLHVEQGVGFWIAWPQWRRQDDDSPHGHEHPGP